MSPKYIFGGVLTLGICLGLFGIVRWVRQTSPLPAAPLATCTTHHATYETMGYPALADGKDPAYALLLADTPDKLEYGLMNVTKKSDICGYDGMIFMMPRREVAHFWNKNTLVDLSIHWIDTDKLIGQVKLPHIGVDGVTTTVSSPGPVTMVIELIQEADDVLPVSPSKPPQATHRCVVGGCSGQLCTREQSEGGGMMSTCEWREEYACYRSATCAFDDTLGTCAWRMTPELTRCLESTKTAPGDAAAQ